MEELVFIVLLLMVGGGETTPDPNGKDQDKDKDKDTGDGKTNGVTKLPELPDINGKPEPGLVSVGDVKPLPKPDKKVLTPAGGIPSPSGKLVFSSDCKTAQLKPGWQDAIAAQVEAAVAAGAGLPVYAPQKGAKSVDAVIRTVVNAQTGNACIDSAPWLDRYANQNPPPVPATGEPVLEYYQRAAAWDQAWDAKIKGWADAHPQAFAAFKQIGNYIVGRWVGEHGFTPKGPGLPGPSKDVKSIPPSQRTADINQLRALGYDIGPIVVEDFQEEFNLVMDYRTDFGWSQFGMALEPDNKLGPLTRAALQEALMMSGGSSGQWSLILQSAREGIV